MKKQQNQPLRWRMTISACVVGCLPRFAGFVTMAEEETLSLRVPRDKGHSFSALQLTGPPDTPKPGDYGTCWAAASADGGKVWIEVRYSRPVLPAQLWVYENCAPGALYQVTGIDDNEEILLWRGVDPTPRTVARGVSKIDLKTKRRLDRFRIYLDTRRVSGWNEIDAVGLLDSQTQKLLWATAATASSVYGRGKQLAFHDPFADPRDTMQESLALLRSHVNAEHQRVTSLRTQLQSSQERLKKLQQQLSVLEQQLHQLQLHSPRKSVPLPPDPQPK